jgi:dual specificity tyrosine-phosphorylation-regulated kinase 2/3/4
MTRPDRSGAPRVVINSKGRRRRPGTKNLAQVLRCNDEEFVDFIAKCLVWDPERRIKPQAAMRHPFIISGKSKAEGANTASSSPSKPASTSIRGKTLTETPKKSQIGAPTPLTARVARVSNINTTSLTSSTSTKLYRSQPGIGSLSYHPSTRALNGLAVSQTRRTNEKTTDLQCSQVRPDEYFSYLSLS